MFQSECRASGLREHCAHWTILQLFIVLAVVMASSSSVGNTSQVMLQDSHLCFPICWWSHHSPQGLSPGLKGAKWNVYVRIARSLETWVIWSWKQPSAPPEDLVTTSYTFINCSFSFLISIQHNRFGGWGCGSVGRQESLWLARSPGFNFQHHKDHVDGV